MPIQRPSPRELLESAPSYSPPSSCRFSTSTILNGRALCFANSLFNSPHSRLRRAVSARIDLAACHARNAERRKNPEACATSPSLADCRDKSCRDAVALYSISEPTPGVLSFLVGWTLGGRTPPAAPRQTSGSSGKSQSRNPSASIAVRQLLQLANVCLYNQ